jgi:membrane protein
VRLPGKGMSWKEFLKGLKDEISKDNLTDLAATVTYYGILALFPFLLFLLALATLFITPADAQRIVDQLSQVAPGPATQILSERIQQLGQQQNVTLVGFGALGAIWAASGGVTALIGALNRTYDVKEGRPFWKVRGVAILMTLVSGALALVAALVAIAAAPLAGWIGGPIGTAIGWLRLPVAGLVMMLLWALIYYVLPDVEQDFKFITPGSVIGVVVWVVASWAFSKYVTSFGSYDKTYGSLGGVIVLLLWMWISSLVLLFGAELNAFVEHRSEEGKRQGAKSTAEKGLTPVAESRPVDEPAPARASGGPRPGDAGRPAARDRARPPVRGLVAIAAGLAAGVLLARREA